MPRSPHDILEPFFSNSDAAPEQNFLCPDSDELEFNPNFDFGAPEKKMDSANLYPDELQNQELTSYDSSPSQSFFDLPEPPPLLAPPPTNLNYLNLVRQSERIQYQTRMDKLSSSLQDKKENKKIKGHQDKLIQGVKKLPQKEAPDASLTPIEPSRSIRYFANLTKFRPILPRGNVSKAKEVNLKWVMESNFGKEKADVKRATHRRPSKSR